MEDTVPSNIALDFPRGKFENRQIVYLALQTGQLPWLSDSNNIFSSTSTPWFRRRGKWNSLVSREYLEQRTKWSTIRKLSSQLGLTAIPLLWFWYFTPLVETLQPSLFLSLSFYIRPFPSLALYLSKTIARPLDNGDRHLATSGGSIALHDLHENLLWNFHEIAWRGEGRERLAVPPGWSSTVLHRVVYLSRLPSGIVTLTDF